MCVCAELVLEDCSCWVSASVGGEDGVTVSVAVSVGVSVGALSVPEVGAGVDAPLVTGVRLGGARRPVVWIIEPSLRERIRVDWTPGREVRWERSAETCWGIWGPWVDIC